MQHTVGPCQPWQASLCGPPRPSLLRNDRKERQEVQGHVGGLRSRGRHLARYLPVLKSAHIFSSADTTEEQMFRTFVPSLTFNSSSGPLFFQQQFLRFGPHSPFPLRPLSPFTETGKLGHRFPQAKGPLLCVRHPHTKIPCCKFPRAY